MDQIAYQDLAMMESQGRISPRDTWRIGTSDRGLALYHEMLLREGERVQQGLDPAGVIRDPYDERATPVLWEPKAHFHGNGIKLYPLAEGLARVGARD
jgi:5,5'-dehydrodivanillate O-demethylase